MIGTEGKGRAVTRDLNPRATGQYFKIIPKHWRKKSYPCMALEMYGCDVGLGKD